MTSKVTTMHDAVAELVRDGDTVAIEGFTHLICFAAGHEIIRQRRRDLTLARMTPDVIYDQMVGAGVAEALIFSWLGNPGVGSLHAVRLRIHDRDPGPLRIEDCGLRVRQLEWSPRIGIRVGTEHLWRCSWKGNPNVSGSRPARRSTDAVRSEVRRA